MLTRISRALALLAVSMTAATTARADVIGGTFSGTATGGSFRSGNSVNLAGSPVTGSFDVATLAGVTPSPGGSASAVDYTLPGGSLSYSFTFSANNETFSFYSFPNDISQSGINLTDNGLTQSVDLLAFVDNPHNTTLLSLTGPEGSLFSNVGDIASLHTGTGVRVTTSVVSSFLDGAAGISLTNAVFISQPVPEPPALPLLAGALLVTTAIGFIQRRVFDGTKSVPTSGQPDKLRLPRQSPGRLA